jgi:hypothetical protein
MVSIIADSAGWRLRLLQRRRPARKQKDLCRAAKVSLELAFPAAPGLFGPS